MRVSPWNRWRRYAMAAILLMLQSEWVAALQVQVLDRNGKPVPDVVVTLAAPRAVANKSNDTSTASMTMDQINMRFVPQVLVVPVGAAVKFPNSDSVSHQVYSFSPAKTFQLSLYKGSSNPPVIFDTAGLVVLGCNIHDEMVGYVYVTDANGYGKTDAQGQFVWNGASAGPATVTLWSPMIADATTTLSRTVELNGDAAQVVEFKLTKTLRSSAEPHPRHADWDY